ncbi:glycerate kinase family protein [Halobacillus litoralis]|uniref:Glycerate kinase n=1 Tax=Halobacillus litoralis TaxID=45668 RepID=A0A410MFS1_9BACI|nr:glycerate kinase [Halobacillus litoralis]QAS53571.1 glycerate kinase [Halobacillus litoralis]
MKIVIAPDSFKGSLSADQVSLAMEEGIHAAVKGAETIRIPVADGGEGTIDALGKWVSREVPVQVKGPTGEKVDTSFVELPYEGKVVTFIECARSTGLTLVPSDQRKPFLLNSFGLGEQIRAAIEKGSRNLFISLGGSATTDGGTGLLQALGYRFFDEKGERLPEDRNVLTEIADMDDRDVLPELEDCKLTIASDVTNPFYGEKGAAHVYGPQKGANQEDVLLLDQGLEKFAEAVRGYSGIDLQEIPGAGAAGGLGGALAGVLHATMKSGFRVVADLVKLDEMIAGADLVLTGEGSLDAQSADGKVPVSVGKIADKHDVPAVAVAGAVETEGDYTPLTAVFSIQPGPCSLEQAVEAETAYNNIVHITKQVVRLRK